MPIRRDVKKVKYDDDDSADHTNATPTPPASAIAALYS